MGENARDKSGVAENLPVVHECGGRTEGRAAVFRQCLPEEDDHNEGEERAEEREKREDEAPAEKNGEFAPDNRRHAGADPEENRYEGEDLGSFHALPAVAHDRLTNHRSRGSAEPHQKAPAVEHLNRIRKHAPDGGEREDDRGGDQHPAAAEGVRERADHERRAGKGKKVERERLLHRNGGYAEVALDIPEGRHVGVGCKGTERRNGGEQNAVRELRGILLS